MLRISHYEKFLDSFVKESREILGENLTGIYLHGSAAMDCFNGSKSDLDLLVIVNGGVPDQKKKAYMEMVVAFNENAPAKGLELSVVKREYCNPFVYPTPFELHFSNGHLTWYLTDPDGYIEKMKGTDKDLAAHFTITYHRGVTLYGQEIKNVFAEVGKKEYFDSIWNDIADAKTDILSDPVYITLNLCRVLAYVKDGQILSKKEGGEWGIQNLPGDHHSLIHAALEAYGSDQAMAVEKDLAKAYAEYMLEKIVKQSV